MLRCKANFEYLTLILLNARILLQFFLKLINVEKVEKYRSTCLAKTALFVSFSCAESNRRLCLFRKQKLHCIEIKKRKV